MDNKPRDSGRPFSASQPQMEIHHVAQCGLLDPTWRCIWRRIHFGRPLITLNRGFQDPPIINTDLPSGPVASMFLCDPMIKLIRGTRK